MTSVRAAWMLLLGLCPVLLAQAADDDELLQYVQPDGQPAAYLMGWRAAWGDSVLWAQPQYGDSAWRVVSGAGLWVQEGGPAKGVRWYRKRIFLSQPADSLATLALYLRAAVAASELYWDGRLIGRNGVPAASARAERAGRSGQLVVVPGELSAPGEHLLALRVSNQRTFCGFVESPPQIGAYAALLRHLFWQSAVMVFLAGVFIFTGIFHLAVLLGYRERRPYAIFSAFCLANAAYILIQCAIAYMQVDLGGYYGLAAINDIPWLMMLALLPVFFLYEYSFPRMWLISFCIVTITIIVVGLPRLVTAGVLPLGLLRPLMVANQMHSYATIVAAAAVSGWAVARRQSGSLISSAGLLVFLVGVALSWQLRSDYGWAVGFAALIVFLTVSLSRQMAQRNRSFQETQLRAARLELDLLKKHIQPHFLLNSLNSIIAWVEEDPATAARLVQALADELRMLLRFASEQTVALADELRLCELHLQVMSLRHDKRFELRQEVSAEGVRVPPLILHTLVENGLTHGFAGRQAGTFVARCSRRPAGVRLELFNDGDVGPGAGDGEGTGLRYVRSRLAETYPGRWNLRAGPVAGGWQVVIEVDG